MKPHWELAFKPASQLRELIINKQVSPVDIIKDSLKRLEELNPTLNAFLTVTPEIAIEEARKAEKAIMSKQNLGLLHGLPIAIKDHISTAGIRTTSGSLIFKNNIPNKDDLIVQRLKSAGSISLGKTNLPEFGMIAATENYLGNDCVNPWDITRISGGSSGGAAASVAAGITPFSQGSDGGGSIRIPASLCGNFGIKPTTGRIPTTTKGVIRTLPQFTFSAISPVSRTVKDSALFLQSVSGPSLDDPNCIMTQPPNLLDHLEKGIHGYKIAWSPNLGSALVDKEVAESTEIAAKSFQSFGANVDLFPFSINNESLFRCFSTIMYTMMYQGMGNTWEKHGAKMKPWLQTRFEYGSNVTGKDFVLAMEEMEKWKHTIDSVFENYDLLLTPTISVPAFQCGKWPTEINSSKIDEFSVSQNAGFYHFAYPFNMSGNPAASIPCGFSSEGLPIGLQIIGKRGDELSVLKASTEYEKSHPWAKFIPPISIKTMAK
ncbi:MAG: amidase [SAR202 cluster bacterium]|nr:amidase [SAR202 cluster bacterium]|tara:strand:+ start:18960 stop:20426 length:1467 start_codon:yes stop_codon:yes gene_type:complete